MKHFEKKLLQNYCIAGGNIALYLQDILPKISSSIDTEDIGLLVEDVVCFKVPLSLIFLLRKSLQISALTCRKQKFFQSRARLLSYEA